MLQKKMFNLKTYFFTFFTYDIEMKTNKHVRRKTYIHECGYSDRLVNC